MSQEETMRANGHAGDDDRALVRAPSATTALEPRDVNETMSLAQKLVASGLLPKSIQKPEAALAIILAGRELGLTTMQSLRSIHIIEGKPTLSADLMTALVKRSPTCRYFKLVESTGRVATYETYREGEGVTRMSFTIEQAQAAGVAGKDNWRKYPDAMLRARCIAALARAVYPDLLAGIYETDELAPAPRQGAPAPVVELKTEAVDAEYKTEIEESDEEKIARWQDAITAAPTLERLQLVARELKKEALPETVRATLTQAYKERKVELSAPAREPGSDE